MLISGVEQEFWNILVKKIYPLDTRNFSNAKFVYAILSRIFFEMYKIKKFLVSSGYMKLDPWNFLSSTFEIFDFEIWNFLYKKKLNFSKFLMSREKIFIQYFEIFMACYKVHGPKFWILDPFCAFLPSFPGRNVQKIHRQSNLQAFEQSLQILLLSYPEGSFLEPAPLVPRLSILPKASSRPHENQRKKTIFALEIFSSFQVEAPLLWM